MLAVSATNLTYAHSPSSGPALRSINLQLPPGSRTLLVGANGAGKSTLLQILAGKKLVGGTDIRVKGRDVFRNTPDGITYLGTEWAMNPVVRSDIVVSTFLDSVGGYRHKERRDHLLDILDIDLDWRMHQISDGERRRVQLCFGLMVPWDILLLDEVTVDLDVLVRDDLLKFLKNDGETRGSTIIYATHIFDGLNDFPTHVAHMHLGSMVTPPLPWPILAGSPLSAQFTPSTPLYSVALQWLKEDRVKRRELEQHLGKIRGARREQAVPTDSEAFYKRFAKVVLLLGCAILTARKDMTTATKPSPHEFNLNLTDGHQAVANIVQKWYSAAIILYLGLLCGLATSSMETPKRPEIIDLTGPSPSKPPKFIDLTLQRDDGATSPSKHSRSSGRAASTEDGKKKPRRRRKKKSLCDENSQSNTPAATREPTAEPVERKSTRNASHTNHPRRTSPHPEDTSQPFFIDVTPVSIPSTVLSQHEIREDPQTSKLLLPSHVAVFEDDSVQIIPPSQREIGEEDYIEYLEFGEHKDIPRYFEDQSKGENKPGRLVCKNCGAEGEHKTIACPVIICLTCGVRNEHGTRSCPISKVCFTCGMKGHINATCPNRYMPRGGDSDRYSDCGRCNSRLHKTNECPSWWRLYGYLADEERSRLVELRKEKKGLELGSGGEGYIGGDPWCYNCGSIGHWGDDCDEVPHRYDRPEESSAFSLYNVMSGPFYDPDKEQANSKPTRSHRDNDRYEDDWFKDVPGEVGKQGRRKNMALLGKHAREQEQIEEDDWFGRSTDLKIRGQAKQDDRGGRRDEPRRASKITFGKSVADAGKRLGTEDPTRPSLLSRISDDTGSRDNRVKSSRNDDRRRHRDGDDWDRWEGKSRHGREREYDYERDRDRHRNRPRYKGGYMR
ncbi:hypothetical protein AX15_004517 [Amanita polypyramis BW_CC]|nr:hypothetical protein AX15_004517 [Amanita polypyramis BW_CC]